MNLHAISPSLLETLVRLTLATSLFSLGIWLLRLALARRLSATWLYGLGLAILLRALLPSVPEGRWTWQNWAKLPVSASAEPAVSIALPPSTLPLAGNLPPMPPPTAPLPSPASRFSWQVLALSLWVCGGVVVVCVALYRQQKFARRIAEAEHVPTGQTRQMPPELLTLLAKCCERAGIRHPVKIVMLAETSSPALFGLWSPKIIISGPQLAKLTKEQWEHVFMHELMHLKHRDSLLNWLILAAQAVHWFNPIVRLALRQLLRDREVLRDAQAIKMLGNAPTCRIAYGHTLLQLASEPQASQPPPSLAMASPTKSEIARRITILTNAPKLMHSKITTLLATSLLSSLTLATFTQAEPEPAAPPPEETKVVRGPILLDKVAFNEARLTEVVDYLRQKVKPLNFQLTVSESTANKIVSLTLSDAHLNEVLKTICEQTKTQFSESADIITITEATAATEVVVPADAVRSMRGEFWRQILENKLRLEAALGEGLGPKHPKIVALNSQRMELEKLNAEDNQRANARGSLESKQLTLETKLQYDTPQPGNKAWEAKREKMIEELIQTKLALKQL